MQRGKGKMGVRGARRILYREETQGKWEIRWEGKEERW